MVPVRGPAAPDRWAVSWTGLPNVAGPEAAAVRVGGAKTTAGVTAAVAVGRTSDPIKSAVPNRDMLLKIRALKMRGTFI
jgi:hypothetical protein